MRTVIKLVITLFVLGFMSIFVAVAIQHFNRDLSDIFGYTGFGLWAFDVIMIGTAFIVKLWRNDVKD